MRWIVSGLVVSLTACGGGKAALGTNQGGSDSGTNSGLDGGSISDAGTDGGVDAGPTTDAGSDAGSSGDAGFDAGDGEGKCYYSITPAYWNWDWSFEGVTFPIQDGGFFLNLFSINNLGPNECLVTYPTLTPGTNAAFSLLEPPDPVLVAAPGNDAGLPSSLAIVLWFAPPGPGVYTGGVTFNLSDPSAPSEVTAFSAEIDDPGPSCVLLRPSVLDFGPVTRGPCPGAHALSFIAINGCAQEVTIQSATFSDGGPFALVSDQAPQTVAQGGTSSPITIDFPGGEDGFYSGTLFVQTDLRSEPLTVTLVGAISAGTAQADTFTFEGNYLFLLSGTPDRDGPTLTVNGTALRNGVDWSYDPLTNILAIDSTKLTLNLGDRIEISYHLACS